MRHDVLVVVDMQNDFISGSLGTGEAVKILPAVKALIAVEEKRGALIVYTKDTHGADYFETQEGDDRLGDSRRTV